MKHSDGVLQQCINAINFTALEEDIFHFNGHFQGKPASASCILK